MKLIILLFSRYTDDKWHGLTSPLPYDLWPATLTRINIIRWYIIITARLSDLKTLFKFFSARAKNQHDHKEIYRPISLLSKIHERLIFNFVFNYFKQNTLFALCQSSFILGDYYLNLTCECQQNEVSWPTLTLLWT